jgi:hypothetical protein
VEDIITCHREPSIPPPGRGLQVEAGRQIHGNNALLRLFFIKDSSFVSLHKAYLLTQKEEKKT